jgi:hypothetical protein
MKWVLVRPGLHRLVEDSDDRPAVKLKSKGVPKGLHTPYTPPWKKYELGMTHPDNNKQGEYTDKFNDVREHEMKTDPVAKRWEESRKERLAKDKPYWVKEQMKKEQMGM